MRATPRARRAMRERGLGGVPITGSGPAGRIVEADVLRAAAAPPAAANGIRRPFSAMRRTIARRLLLSKQTVPHFYVRQTVDAEPLVAAYSRCKAEFPCSLNDLIVKAAAIAVREFPTFRSRLDGDELVELPNAHIGLAVGFDDGLIVPAVLNADRLELRDLAAETRRIVDLARVRKIENSGAAVFTVSNLGMFGTEEFTAIINPPEAAILAVGAVREAAVARAGGLRAAKVLTLTLSCDHRIIDGVAAARFAARLRQILESPEPHLHL